MNSGSEVCVGYSGNINSFNNPYVLGFVPLILWPVGVFLFLLVRLGEIFVFI